MFSALSHPSTARHEDQRTEHVRIFKGYKLTYPLSNSNYGKRLRRRDADVTGSKVGINYLV